MVEKDPTPVQAAFETLLEEMEKEIEFINQSGAKAFAARNYEAARALMEGAEQIIPVREKLAALRLEWEKVAPAVSTDGTVTKKDGSHDPGHLQQGIRTRETDYFKPILQVLNQMGGVGDVADVSDRLPKVMKGTLTDTDFEPLADNPEVPRWWNAAQWAQSTMVKAGLLKADSPRGIWEMTEAGHKLIAEFNS